MAYEDTTFHPVVLATDATDYQANTLTRITQGAAYGGGSALASGLLSIVNTFLPKEREVDAEQLIRKYGGNEMGDYYVDNKSAVDVVGFVGTSLIPGSLGIKGLNMLRRGEAAGNFGKFLNIPVTRKDEYLQKALQEMSQEGGTVVKSILSSNRRKQLAWETADQALQGAAFELAVAATMNDSPVFDNSTYGDYAWTRSASTDALGRCSAGSQADGTHQRYGDSAHG
jgi:hypothetical protein